MYDKRISGSIMIVAGGYIVLFWVTTLSGGGSTNTAPVVWVERLSSAATKAGAGAGIRLGIAAAVLRFATATWALVSTHRHRAVPPRGASEPSVEPWDQSR